MRKRAVLACACDDPHTFFTGLISFIKDVDAGR